MRFCHVLIPATWLVGCIDQLTVTHPHALTEPVHLCRERVPQPACRTVEDVEAMLGGDLEIISADDASGGFQRARVLTLRSRRPGSVVFRAKWRAHSTTTPRNSPRFELAAYALQKLFLEPHEYVVPPTAPYCFPLAAYHAIVDRNAHETFPRSGCVYGVLSYWLEDVTAVHDANKAGWFHGLHHHVFDPHLFERDLAYRDSLTRVNLLSYLIAHGDTHARNFVIARSETEPPVHTVYSIDNSKSFTAAKNTGIKLFFNWSMIRVPALPRAPIERMRSADLSSLAAIAVLRPASDRLVATEIGAEKTQTGIDWTSDQLVIGLTPPEIEVVRVRIDALLQRIDRNDLGLY